MERKEIDKKYINAVKLILEYIGEDPDREGLDETPERFLKAWKEYWGSGYSKNPEDIVKVFYDGGEFYDEMILVKDIKVMSHCEHHIAPIIGKCHIAYIPNDKGGILGLSKLNRLVDMYCRRLQVQERLTTQIANTLQELLHPKGVAVFIEADHFCVKTRGIQDITSYTETCKLLGAFKDEEHFKHLFFKSIKGVR